MVNSRDKGKRGERQARDMVRRLWYSPDCRRAQQYSGTDGTSDLKDALEGFHAEVKWRAAIGAVRYFEQADADRDPDDLPLVLMREDKRKRWFVLFDIEHTEQFVQSYLRQRDNAA